MKRNRFLLSFVCLMMFALSMLSLTACSEKVNNFKLSFKVDSEVYQTITTNGNEGITIPENPTKTGYEFDGWFWDKDVWSKPFTANSLLDAPISSDMSVYAKFNAIVYDITYNLDGGTHNNPLSYTIEDSIVLSDAEKIGYSFVGWYSDSNYNTKVETISAGATGDTTLYAKFEIENYTITYTNTKDVDNNNPTSYNVNSEAITLDNLSKDGYTFDGWYNGEEKVTEIAKGSTGNLTLEARWTAIDYEIIYHNVNEVTNSNPENYNVDEQPLVLVDLEKAGYNFLGWFTDENFTNEITEISVGTTGEINLYAKWEIVEYIATFMDGTTVVEEVKFTVETESIDDPAVPDYVGYSGKWEDYTLGTEDIIIDAVYTAIEYTATFMDGTTVVEEIKFTVETESIEEPAVPNHVGYNGEWEDYTLGTESITIDAVYTAIEYTATFMDGTTVVDVIKFTVETESVDEPTVPNHVGYNGEWEEYTLEAKNITIDAVYTAIEYTATFMDGTTVVEEIKFTVETESIEEPAVPNHVGYNGEWEDYELALQDITIDAVYTAIEYTATFMDGTTVVDEIIFTVETEIIDEPAVPVHLGYTGEWEDYTLEAKNITIDAVYTLIPYTIIYNNVDDTTNTNPTTYNVQTQTIILVDAEKEGYTFRGWYSDEEFENAVTEIATGTIGNIELYAKWQQNEYTITFDSNGGTGVESITDYYGVAIEEPTKPTKEKYYFVGWFLASGGNDYEFTTMPAENITLYARWEAYSLTLTYDETIQGVSSLKEVTAESFGAKCIDNGGNLVDVSVTINGTVAAGEIITVRLKATANGVIAQKTISNVRVYGMPTLTFDNTVDYVNVNGGLTASHFGASGTDSFGQATKIEVYIDGDYQVGSLVTVTIASIDPAGNTVYGYVENVKAYGLPEITYNKTAISVNDTLSAEVFNATAKDSFSENVDVSVNIVSVVSGFVNGEIYNYNTSTTKDYQYFTALNSETYTLHYKNGTSDSRTYIKVYCVTTSTTVKSASYYTDYSSYSTLTFSVKAGYEYYICTYAYSSSYTTNFSMYLTSASNSLGTGAIATIRLSATDSKGNVTNIDVECKVYGAPIISDSTVTEIKLSDDITSELLGVSATDTYGESLDITFIYYKKVAGKVLTVMAKVTDIAGNVTTKDFELRVYGTPTIIYDREGVKITEDDVASFVPVTISFDLNGGSGNIESQIVTHTKGLSYPSTIPTKEGYAFTGWYTSKECTELYDFTKVIENDITLYAGWEAMVTSGDVRRYIDIYNNYNSSSNAYSSAATYGYGYTYFTALNDGQYTIYYSANSLKSTSESYAYIYAYNSTQGSGIISYSKLTSTSYSSKSFTAKAGDIICVRTHHSPHDGNYIPGWRMYVIGASTPADGGTARNLLNVVAKDSFGNDLAVTANIKSGSFTAGRNIICTLTAIDHLGNIATLDTKELGVYDVNDIKLTYNAGMADIIKLTSKGEEFNAKATDPFGNACDITIEPAEGYTLAGGNIISLYIVATDKAGNKVYSDLIEGIKVYDMPTVTLNQNGYLWDENFDLDFLFTVTDSFGEELYAIITEVKTTDYYKVIRVQAEDDCGNIFDKDYTFTLNNYNYTYTYHLDGGENNPNNPTSYLNFVGEDKLDSINLLNPTKAVSKRVVSCKLMGNGLFEVAYEITRYTFEGWFIDSDHTDEIKTIFLEMGSLTLYAKWNTETTTSVEEKAYVRIDDDDNENAEGDSILFGEYPQTIKADNVTITSTQNDKGYYLGSDGNYYAKVVADVYTGGYKFSTGNTITRGATYYFKVEPIKWRILTESNGEALILCEMIIDVGAYDERYYTEYAASDIRAWLNNQFYNTAFSELQRTIVLTTNVDNSARSTNPNINATQFHNGVNSYSSGTTKDKVFLLSMQEITNSAYGFNDSYSSSDTVRIKQGTDYAKCRRLKLYTTSGKYYGNSEWWLRSPYPNDSTQAWCVGWSGAPDNWTNVSYAVYGVVPALKIQL